MISYLRKLTGIEDLVPNAKELFGAGIHKITEGGFLNIHTDFNMYKDSKYGLLDRRINILIYLNPNWIDDYGGHLWICDSQRNKINDKILPILNRCVIFNTTNKSLHGHPIPLTPPNQDVSRNSLALYYYTPNKNNGKKCFEGDYPHTTIYYPTKNFN